MGNSKDTLNDNMIGLLTAIKDASKPSPDECVDLIFGLMCHVTFPLCDYNSSTPMPRKV